MSYSIFLTFTYNLALTIHHLTQLTLDVTYDHRRYGKYSHHRQPHRD
jgi:hypothetical protein